MRADTDKMQFIEKAGERRLVAQGLQPVTVQVQHAKPGPRACVRLINIRVFTANSYRSPGVVHAVIIMMIMETLLSANQIQERVGELARQIAADYKDRPVTIVGVLTGSLIFLADLVRQLDLPLRIGLVQASSYRGGVTEPGDLRFHPELVPDVQGRHVLLLDDILDTGQTLTGLVEHLRALGAKSVRVVVLLRKQGRQKTPLKPDYCGFEIPNAFVVGYGLDFDDEHRHLPYIAVLREYKDGIVGVL